MNKVIHYVAGTAIVAATSLYAANADAKPNIKFTPKKPAAAAGTTPTPAPAATPAATPGVTPGKDTVSGSKHREAVKQARADGFKNGKDSVTPTDCPPQNSAGAATPQNNANSNIKVNDRRSSRVRRNVNGCEAYVASEPQFQNKYGVCATDSGRDDLKKLGVSVFNTIPASEYRSLSKRFASCPGESICTVVGTDDMRNVNAMLGGKLNDALKSGSVDETLMRKIIAEYTLNIKRELSVNMSGAVTPVDLAPEASQVTAGFELLMGADANILSAVTAGYQLSWRHISAEGLVGYMFLDGGNSSSSDRIVDYDSTKLALGTQILKDVATDTKMQGKHMPFAGLSLGAHYDLGESVRAFLQVGPMLTLSDRGTGQSNMYHMHQSANPAVALMESNTPSPVATEWTFGTGYAVNAGLDIKLGQKGKTSLVLTPKAILRCLNTELGDNCYGGLGVGGKF
jgi:hypothetical protein